MWQYLIPVLEIAVIFYFLYYLISFFWNTRAKDLILGLFAFVAIYALAEWLNFPVLSRLMQYVVNISMIALVVIFQPEIRLALRKLSIKGKSKDISDFDKFLDSLSQAMYHLADKRIGALVIIENQDTLEEFVNNAVRIDAAFTPELLESLFMTTTPLHDGGVVIRGDRIISAATILPLADETTQISKSMGTRHRAGLGISQITDALIIVVSEETGKVSIARDGIITRSVKPDRFKGIIKSIFTPVTIPLSRRFNLIQRMRAWSQ